jgi:hypothetical protein
LKVYFSHIKGCSIAFRGYGSLQKKKIQEQMIRSTEVLKDWEDAGPLDYLAAKKLLDVIAAILAEEYVQTARQNPDIFKEES